MNGMGSQHHLANFMHLIIEIIKLEKYSVSFSLKLSWRFDWNFQTCLTQSLLMREISR